MAKYVAPLSLDVNETKERATSWGLMQIMGQVARELGYTGDLQQLLEPQNSLDYGCKKLRQCFDRTDGSNDAALLRYNGGGNKNYASQVKARMPKYY
jgi:soluble lytic murein transglycosylase-like protein